MIEGPSYGVYHRPPRPCPPAQKRRAIQAAKRSATSPSVSSGEPCDVACAADTSNKIRVSAGLPLRSLHLREHCQPAIPRPFLLADWAPGFGQRWPDLDPAMAQRQSSSPPCSALPPRGFLAQQQDRRRAILRFASASRGAGRSPPAPFNRHQGRDGRGLIQHRR